MLSGENGILNRAAEAKEETERATKLEQVQLAVLAAQASGNGDINLDVLNSELKEAGYKGDKISSLPATVTIGDYEYTIQKDGKVSEGNVITGDEGGTGSGGSTPEEEGTLNVTATPYEGTYDESAHGITVICDPSDATIEYSSDGITYSSTNPTYTDVGTYTTYYKVSKNGYKTVEESLTVSITYVGCYADLEGDGKVDGVIYADLVAGAKGDGEWTNGEKYTLPEVTNAKNYYVSQQSYEGAFGTKAVLSPTGTGNNRFYVMALENFTTNSYIEFSWYYNAYSGTMTDYSTYTSGDFGTGKSNTIAMLTKWYSSAYGAQNARDVWGAIQGKVDDGWFMPSRAEWAAFSEELQITSSNYEDYGLSNFNWSSSQSGINDVWTTGYDHGFMICWGVNGFNSVRLSTTF